MLIPTQKTLWPDSDQIARAVSKDALGGWSRDCGVSNKILDSIVAPSRNAKP